MKLYKCTDGRANISGSKIKEIRESLGLSQEQLAVKIQIAGLNLTQKAISRIETGDRVIPDFELILFSEVLNVPICSLLYSDANSAQKCKKH